MSTAISSDKHLFREVQWKSHLFPGSQVHCQELQSCTVLRCSTYICSKNTARSGREGPSLQDYEDAAAP